MKTIQIAIPYQKQHLRKEVKIRGGRYNSETKTWTIEANPENQFLADLIQKPAPVPTIEERIAHVAATCADLLNAIGHRNYKVTEAGDRVLIESTAKDA